MKRFLPTSAVLLSTALLTATFATPAAAWNDNGNHYTLACSVGCELNGFVMEAWLSTNNDNWFVRLRSTPIHQDMLTSTYLGMTWPLGTTTINLGTLSTQDQVCDHWTGQWLFGPSMTVVQPSDYGSAIEDTSTLLNYHSTSPCSGSNVMRDLIDTFNGYKLDSNFPEVECDDRSCGGGDDGVNEGDWYQWYQNLHDWVLENGDQVTFHSVNAPDREAEPNTDR